MKERLKEVGEAIEAEEDERRKIIDKNLRLETKANHLERDVEVKDVQISSFEKTLRQRESELESYQNAMKDTDREKIQMLESFKKMQVLSSLLILD